MFRTSRAPRTITAALDDFRAASDSWFDGTVQSVDKRLSRCSKLLHNAQAAAADDPVSQLTVLAELSADRRALKDLRHDLLTGASGREAGTTLPGRRLASSDYDETAWLSAAWGDDEDDDEDGDDWPKPKRHGSASPIQLAQDFAASGAMDDADPADLDMQDLLGEYLRQQGHDPSPELLHQVSIHLPRYAATAAEAEDYGNRIRRDVPPEYRSRPEDFPPGFRNLVYQKVLEEKEASLSPEQRRWVTLEAARFHAAQTDARTDVTECAERARRHAALRTASHTVIAAFTAEVAERARRSPRPRVAAAAPVFIGFDDSQLYF